VPSEIEEPPTSEGAWWRTGSWRDDRNPPRAIRNRLFKELADGFLAAPVLRRIWISL